MQQRIKRNSTKNTQLKFQEIYDALNVNGRITNEVIKTNKPSCGDQNE